MFFKRMLLAVLLVVVSIPLTILAQDEEIEIPFSVWTTGRIDPLDNSVLYSVLVVTDTDPLSDVTITAALPEGATFVEDFWTPSVATFNGEADGTVTWSLPELPAETIVGPFTYRVTFEDAAALPPVNVAAAVSSGDLAFGAIVEEGTLQPLAAKGSLIVGAEGTDGLVSVEDTGVLIDIPAGTFDQDITLTFERLPFDDTVSLPETGDLWWCTLYSITTEPAVAIENPITILLPTRKTTTPGLPIQFFYQTPDAQWLALENTSAEAALIAGGNHAAVVGFTFDTALDNQIIAAGYVEQDTIRGSINYSVSRLNITPLIIGAR